MIIITTVIVIIIIIIIIIAAYTAAFPQISGSDKLLVHPDKIVTTVVVDKEMWEYYSACCFCGFLISYNLLFLGLKKDIDEADAVLKNVKAGQDLKNAITRRHLGDLEKSMNFIKKNGYEKDWIPELKEGEKLANRLRHLEKLRAEIMELKQSVISEIRSYQNPPPAVHKVCSDIRWNLHQAATLDCERVCQNVAL